MRWLRSCGPLAAVLALGAAVPLLRLHLIHTESAPVGLWRAEPRALPRVGEVARFCMPEEHAALVAGRPYAGGRRGGPCPHDTWMLAKPVLAGPGDTVEHTPAHVTVNGVRQPLSATRAADSRGLPLPPPRYGRHVLGAGEYWMHSPYAEGSFDSRYVGVVGRDQLRGVLRPVLTWLTRRQEAALRAHGVSPARRGGVARAQPASRSTVRPGAAGNARPKSSRLPPSRRSIPAPRGQKACEGTPVL